MGKFKDLTGQVFGRLTVLGLEGKSFFSGRNHFLWRCKCECGGETVVLGKNLKSGHTRSCGCLGGKFKDLTGKKFGRLTAVELAEIKNHAAQWLCKCDCGNTCIVASGSLISGNTRSCGCIHGETFNNYKHGLVSAPLYKKWAKIKERCFNPNCKSYDRYGGRGITMFPAWIDDPAAFCEYVSKLSHCGEKGYTLDRIDNNGNYEPGNLRFATKTVQGRNKRNNIIVEYQDEKMCLSEAAEKSGINYGTLKSRYLAGDTGDRLFRPVKN